MPVLHYAITQYNTRQVEMLTALGANVNQQDARMRTPLQLLCEMENQQLSVRYAKMLLDRGARASVRTTYGNSVFYYACQKQRIPLVMLLLQEREVNLLEPDCHGNTPLHHAVSKGNVKLTEILVRQMRKEGLGVDTVNNRGETANMLASKHGFSVCAEMLRTWGGASETMRDSTEFRTAREWGETKTERRVVHVSKQFREKFPHIAKSLKVEVPLKPHCNTPRTSKQRLPKLAPSTTPIHSRKATTKPVKQVLPDLLDVYNQQIGSSYRPPAMPPPPVPHTTPREMEGEDWQGPVIGGTMQKSLSLDSLIGCKDKRLHGQRGLVWKTWAGKLKRKSLAGS
ncbi:uncharacterized protein LOC116603371 [Nematostella vectensis]|uniref:uncharacterized protein LOC116603371 n=1 Tax=Nematostella vectensis TaxID=45351 RepID=UPI002077338F|nr:uncharacterized protein LOC116603371 [Nematostella vectensis]XP_048582400.1 uncharacterized protein LOC116603371 [Nematostella vectensis]XP_048582401.1 uncharacterized protein LOC116603371 [Nematostella vectensis]XP_048582402.1 uncharacterized protein LOC116603371 [Nematostella vectensis]